MRVLAQKTYRLRRSESWARSSIRMRPTSEPPCCRLSRRRPQRHGEAVESLIGNIWVCDVRHFCPVSVDMHLFSRTRLTPVVSNSGRDREVAGKICLSCLALLSKTRSNLRRRFSTCTGIPPACPLETPRIDDCSGDLAVEFRLQNGEQGSCVVSVFRSKNFPARSWFADPRVWRCSRSGGRRRPKTSSLTAGPPSAVRVPGGPCHTLQGFFGG